MALCLICHLSFSIAFIKGCKSVPFGFFKLDILSRREEIIYLSDSSSTLLIRYFVAIRLFVFLAICPSKKYALSLFFLSFSESISLINSGI